MVAFWSIKPQHSSKESHFQLRSLCSLTHSQLLRWEAIAKGRLILIMWKWDGFGTFHEVGVPLFNFNKKARFAHAVWAKLPFWEIVRNCSEIFGRMHFGLSSQVKIIAWTHRFPNVCNKFKNKFEVFPCTKNAYC